MKRTYIKELPGLIGKTVKVQGWLQTIRDQKRMRFLIIRDHTGLVQTVNERGKLNEEIDSLISTITPESALEITGEVVSNSQVKLGQLEIRISSIRLDNLAEAGLPINDGSSLESRLDWRFLDLRQPKNYLVFRIQTVAEQAMREFWTNHGFIEIHSPKLMASPSESGAELFHVDYFEGNAYLAQSPQFYKQMAISAGFDRVFEIGPVFRANPSFTSRHDTEFTSVDVEISWVESHEDVMQLEEQWLRYILERIKNECGQEILQSFGLDIKVPEVPFPRVTMAEAHAILSGQGYTVPREGKGDLDPEGERRLANHIQQKFGHEFVFVTDYPIAVRPFYHLRPENKPGVTNSFDLIWKGLEVTTGAQREHRYDILVKQAQEKGLTLKPIQYYLNCFKYGCPPHGGYGFGLTRMLMVLLNAKSVREVTFVYRGPNRLTP